MKANMGRRDPENATYKIAKSTGWWDSYTLGTDERGTTWYYRPLDMPCDEDTPEIMRRIIEDLANEVVELRKKYEPEWEEIFSHLPQEPFGRLNVIHTAIGCNQYDVLTEHGRYGDKEETK